jgi:hypothetical protein
MKASPLLQKTENVAQLAARLATCPDIAIRDAGEHVEAWALAHSFSDLEESFRVFLHEHLPGLTNGSVTDAEIREILYEIGEEFRHILYHIKDPRFYQYLQDAPMEQE